MICRDYGFEPIAIETPAGRAEYVRAQQDIAERAAPLRAALADRCDAAARASASWRRSAGELSCAGKLVTLRRETMSDRRGGNMTDRVTVGNLRVAQVLYDFVNNEALAGHRDRPRQLLGGRGQGRHRPDPEEPGPAGPPRRPAGPDRQVAPPARHRAVRPRGVQAVPHRDRLPAARARRLHHHHRRRRRRDHHAPPARSWWCRSSTRGSRSTPPTPAGARCTTRCTAPTSSPRTTAPRRARGYNRVRGDKVIAYARTLPRRRRPAGDRARGPTPPASRSTDGQLLVHARRRPVDRPGRAGAVRRLHRRARLARRGRCCCATTACTSRS